MAPEASGRDHPKKGRAMNTPKIMLDNIVLRSPWLDILERHVDFGRGSVEINHFVNQSDYITVVPVDRSGSTVVVKQYRPAVQRHTLEFPVGTLEFGESGEASALRELFEETGLRASVLHNLGSTG